MQRQKAQQQIDVKPLEPTLIRASLVYQKSARQTPFRARPNKQLWPDELLLATSQYAHHLVSANTILIPMLNCEHTHYTYVSGWGFHKERLVGKTISLSDDFCGQVLQDLQILENPISDSRPCLSSRTCAAVLMAPLMHKSQLLGAILAIAPKETTQFSKENALSLQNFATEAGTVVGSTMRAFYGARSES
ncbi:MAG: hypothetical protein OEY67_01470 [Gammaproteobacteria bacterium]|nr:hypothetical protein [Gammaproteobacteria bacterium]